jgi:hypothetical protein
LDDDDDDDDDEFGSILSEPSTAQLDMIISRRNLVDDCHVLERTSPDTVFYQEVREASHSTSDHLASSVFHPPSTPLVSLVNDSLNFSCFVDYPPSVPSSSLLSASSRCSSSEVLVKCHANTPELAHLHSLCQIHDRPPSLVPIASSIESFLLPSGSFIIHTSKDGALLSALPGGSINSVPDNVSMPHSFALQRRPPDPSVFSYLSEAFLRPQQPHFPLTAIQKLTCFPSMSTSLLHTTAASSSQTATAKAQHQNSKPSVVNKHAVLFCAPFNFSTVHDKIKFAPCSYVVTTPWWSRDGYFSSVITEVPLLLSYHQFVSDLMVSVPLQFTQLCKPPDIAKDSMSLHLAIFRLVVMLNSLSLFDPNSATAIVVSSGLLLSYSFGNLFPLYNNSIPCRRCLSIWMHTVLVTTWSLTLVLSLPCFLLFLWSSHSSPKGALASASSLMFLPSSFACCCINSFDKGGYLIFF